MPSIVNDVRSVLRSSALIAVLLISTLATAQESPRFAETIDVSLVNVDVIVTDRNGNRVRGLKAEDFTIVQEGKPQQIVNFAEYSSAAEATGVTVEGPASAKPAEAAPRQPRTVLVFVDEVALVLSKSDFRPTIAQVLDKALQPGDIGAVLSWTNRLNVRQGFTTDIDAVKSSIGKLPEPGPLPTKDDDPFWSTFMLDPRTIAMNEEAAGMASTLIRQSFATTAFLDMKSKVRAINAAMTAMAGSEGRKVLLLVTHRFSRHAGLEHMLDLRYESRRPPSREPRFDQLRMIESVADTANATGFTIYGLFPEGLRSTLPDAGIMFAPAIDAPPIGGRDHHVVMNETAALELVSDRTGGDYAIGSDVAKLLPRVSEDLTDYYSLGYRTEARGTDNRRRISVRVKNGDYVVRARDAFAERSDATRMRDRVTASVFAAIDPGTIPITAEIAPRTRRTEKVPLKIKIPISALTTLEKNGRQSGAFTVYVAWNTGGSVSESTRQTQSFTINPEDIARAKDSHFTYNFDVLLGEQTRALGIGVLDETSKEYGVVTIDVENG